MGLFSRVSRLVDHKPWAAQLYLTDQCNLKCHYCNEYNNDNPHPTSEELKKRMRKLRELGVLKIQFLGGEPLLHPDVVELVRYARSIGFFGVGMSTNGFLLSKELLNQLELAGLSSMQISVDRMTPCTGTRKSLQSVREKLTWFKESKINMIVTGIIYNETLGEMRQVIDKCVEMGVPVGARLVHDDLINERNLRSGAPVDGMLELLDYQMELKKRGERIHPSWYIMNFQRAQLTGQPLKWKCVGGYKFIFVSAKGKFWICSQVRTDKDIMDVTHEDLIANNHPNKCQDGCGVYCIISTSLMFNHPLRYIGVELRETAAKKRAKRRLKKKLRRVQRLAKRG